MKTRYYYMRKASAQNIYLNLENMLIVIAVYKNRRDKSLLFYTGENFGQTYTQQTSPISMRNHHTRVTIQPAEGLRYN